MIEFYYHAYDDGVEQLCQRIKTNWLVYGIEDNIDCENDIILIHAIYRVATTTNMYRKDDIKSMLWDKIKPLCQIDDTNPYSSRSNIKHFKKGYDDLFDFCWKQRFSKTNDAKKAVKISKIAYTNRALGNKLVNSNLSILLFLILFFFVQTIINDSFFLLKFEDTNEISLTLCVVLLSLSAVGLFRGNYYYFPLIAIVIMAIWSISELFSNSSPPNSVSADITIALLKRNFIMGLSYLLWYPIIFINNNRLHNLYDDIEK